MDVHVDETGGGDAASAPGEPDADDATVVDRDVAGDERAVDECMSDPELHSVMV
jgi:hypothetical protein